MRSHTSKRNRYILYVVLCVSILIAAALLSVNLRKQSAKPVYTANHAQLSVLFIDVGQADSALITLSSGETMLIDAGETSDATTIAEELDERGIRDIDILVATHPHADHIGGMRSVVEHYDIGSILMPDMTSQSAVYQNLMKAVDERGIPVAEAYAGYNFSLGEAECSVVSPDADANKDMNNESVVIFLDYLDNEFLFTGDMEEWAEGALLDTSYNIDADVLKVAHHGSSTGTSPAFLNAVTPQYAVISCGEGNEYGHPHQATLNELQEAGAEIYRTDRSGDILFLSDGKTLTVQTEY